MWDEEIKRDARDIFRSGSMTTLMTSSKLIFNKIETELRPGVKNLAAYFIMGDQKRLSDYLGSLGMADAFASVFAKYYARIRFYSLFRKELGDALSGEDYIINCSPSDSYYGNNIDYGYGNPMPGLGADFIVPNMGKSLVLTDNSSLDSLIGMSNNTSLEDLLDEYFLFTKSGLPDFGNIRSQKKTTMRDKAYYKTLSLWFERCALDETGRFRIPSNCDLVNLFKVETKVKTRRFRTVYSDTYIRDLNKYYTLPS